MGLGRGAPAMEAAPWLVALVAVTAASVGLGAAAVIAPAPQDEQLLEGHTVFTMLETLTPCADCPPPPPSGNRTQYAAAVAVLVRERVEEFPPGSEGRGSFRFPGVLWFNDQYLVNPTDRPASEGDGGSTYSRYPCTGAVIAVNSGDPVPTTGGWASNAGAVYVETYHIVDPNERAWDVDKWNWTTGGISVTLWTVALMNDDASANDEDDGECAGRAVEDGCLVPGCGGGMGDLDSVELSALGLYAADPGANGRRYPCGDDPAPCEALRYNAVLYFLLEDLTDRDVDKDHTEGSSDWNDDVSGCDANTTEWACPGGDDDREGNSHPYDPAALLPGLAATHGGSGLSGARDSHATFRVDVRFGIVTPQPAEDRVYRVMDLMGRTAPFHCHETAPCVP